MIALHKATDAAGFAGLSKAANQASKTFRDAAASTGQFEVQQLRLNSATDDYVKKLNAQKMSFRDMARQRKIANAAYKEQLALENMSVRRNPASSTSNKGVYDVIIPKDVSADVDTARKRLAFFNAELKSGAHQMVNWGKNTQWAGRQLMVGFTMPIAAFGAAAAVMSYQLDKELTRIAKVIDTTATTSMGIEKELAQVRVEGLKTATLAAKEYGSAATDTLNVQAELAATGKTGADLQKSTAEVMRIARLGEVDNQTAIEATIALQSIWRMSNTELTESFNYMNSIENATSLSTADFAEAIPVAASSVKAFGGDVKELGILLTAMKENGIGASEGANALKATMQRLGRPSKQIREEWAALTGTDITKLVDDSDGLIEVFTNIQKATKDLDPDDQRKAFAGLFGSYQVSKMMALTKGMGELQQGIGQVSTAYDVSNQSAEKWAQTAATEVERYQKSISGMWDIAFQSMKVELAELGEPFLVLATQVVKGLSAMLKAFNDLPQGVKVFAALAVGATALAGGVLMLAGLFANLAGNGLKVAASVIGLTSKMKLLDRQTKAGEMVADAAAAATTHQRTAIEMLTMQIEAQTAAQREANMVMGQAAGLPGYGPGGVASPIMSPGARNKMTDDNRAQYQQTLRDKYLTQGPSGKQYYSLDPGGSGMQASNRSIDDAVDTDMRREAVAINDEYNRSAKESLDVDNERKASAKARNKFASQTGAFMAIESAALATSLISSNKMVDDFAKIVMFAGLMGPAVALIGPAAANIATKIKEGAAASKAASVTALANAKSTTAGAAGANKFAKGMTLAKGALLGLMGPLGWTVAAVAAIGLTVYKFYRDAQEKQEEIIKAQERLADTATNWGESLGLARKEQEKISMLALAGENDRRVTDFEKDRAYFTDSESGKKEVEDLKGLDPAGQRAAAMAMIIDVQREFGVSANRAETMVAAMWAEATGTSATKALQLMQEYSGLIGNLKTPDLSGMWNELAAGQKTALSNSEGDSGWDSDAGNMEARISAATAQAGNIGEAFATAWFNSDSESEWDAQMKSFSELAAQQWTNSFSGLSTDPGIADVFKELGIKGGTDLAVAMQQSGFREKLQAMMTPESFALFEQMTAGAEKYEIALVSAAASATGMEGEFRTIAEMQKNAAIAAAMMTREQKKQAAIDAVSLVDSTVSAEYKAISQDSATATLNALLMSEGLEKGKNYAEALARWTAFIKGEVYGAAGGANALAGGLSRAKGQAGGLLGLLNQIGDKAAAAEAIKQVVVDAQNELADGYSDQLDAQQTAESEANDAYWDGQKSAQDDRFSAQSDALSSQHDREQKGMEAAWDAKRKGLENYWDGRIEGIDNAIKAEEEAEEKRQKMFDAEIARINKLADMANTKIDFNVALNEGNLDEAAKIANTAMASDAQSVFEREREKGAEKSANRVEGLGTKKEGIEEAKDAAMEAFDAREEAAKAHMQKMQDIESDSLQKRQDMARDDLAKRADMDKKSLDKQHERQKANLDRILKTFLASTPTTKAALQKQVKELGKALDDFGITILDPMSVKWGNWFKNRMRDGLTNSAAEAASADAWLKFGEETKTKMLKAWGFNSEKEFSDFINGKDSTADLTPRGLGSDIGKTIAGGTGEKSGPQTNTKTGATGSRHAGGSIGKGIDNRRGVAKNYVGQAPTERLINARIGEYMVNEDAAKKYGPELEAMNAGRYVGGATGPAGKMGAVMIGSIAKGLMKKGKARMAAKNAAAASMGAGAAGGSGGFNGSGYQPGVGGWQKPSVPGLGWSNTHDYRAGPGTPVYAPSDGVVTRSAAITSGGSPGNGGLTPGGIPYRSYGETIQVRMADGNVMNFGHLSARYVGAGQGITGGALIGRSGNTGNSSGPHLHMDIGGNENASGYLASRGIGLRKGAEYVKFDNTMANLHRGESVLTKRLTEKMHEGVDRFANGDNSEYNVEVNINGYNGDADELARKVEKVFDRKARRRPSSRRVGRG